MLDMPKDKLAEKLAYWYFRLNGCATIEDFVVHGDRRRPQMTDVDVLAVRFPYRQELRLSHKPPMQDDRPFRLLPDKVQIILAEVKANSPCHLNGAWSKRIDENMHRVLYAVGAFPPEQVDIVAKSLYDNRTYEDLVCAVRLFAIGSKACEDETANEPAVQVLWTDIFNLSCVSITGA